MVRGLGEPAPQKKTPAITVPQVRELFADLLTASPASPKDIGAKVSRVLRRNEEARIYHYYKRTKSFPPRRGKSTGAAGPPYKKTKTRAG
jgi:hypothetical protein